MGLKYKYSENCRAEHRTDMIHKLEIIAKALTPDWKALPYQ